MWRTIGTELGVDMDTLNTIGKDNTNDGDRLTAVIDSAAPTREIMAKILESANISNAIAGTIMLLSVLSSQWDGRGLHTFNFMMLFTRQQSFI